MDQDCEPGTLAGFGGGVFLRRSNTDFPLVADYGNPLKWQAAMLTDDVRVMKRMNGSITPEANSTTGYSFEETSTNSHTWNVSGTQLYVTSDEAADFLDALRGGAAKNWIFFPILQTGIWRINAPISVKKAAPMVGENIKEDIKNMIEISWTSPKVPRFTEITPSTFFELECP